MSRFLVPGLLAASVSLTTKGALAQQPAPVDLLQTLHPPIAVASTVGNRTDRPEHLVDGNLETAWNSRSGALQGRAFSFWLPEGVTVDSLRMTAGFTRTTPRGDLFTQNHRLRRITVRRHGSSATAGPSFERSFDLDINRRDLQTIPIGQPGGHYTVQIDATEPGSQRNWREACVSELQVMGRGNFPAWRIQEPLVVDVVSMQDAPLVVGPFPNARALCARLRNDADRDRCRSYGAECGCRLSRAPRVAATISGGQNPVLEAQLATNTTSPNMPPSCWLALRTAAGWSGVSLANCGNPDPSASNSSAYERSSMNLRALSASNGPNGDPVLRVQYDTDEGEVDPDELNERSRDVYTSRTRRALALQCRIAPAGLECLRPQAIAPTRTQ
jgi:hypothetical protein